MKDALTGAVKIGAEIADTGIFEGVPVVSNILSGCSYINDKIESSEEKDKILDEVSRTLAAIEPIVLNLANQSSTKYYSDEAVKGNLRAISSTLEQLHSDVDLFLSRSRVVQEASLLRAENITTTLPETMADLKKLMETLSVALTGETFLAALRIESSLESAVTEIADVHTGVDEVNSELKEMADAAKRRAAELGEVHTEVKEMADAAHHNEVMLAKMTKQKYECSTASESEQRS
jgi:uncharacterized phage infection (PIP) family protein YhgE